MPKDKDNLDASLTPSENAKPVKKAPAKVTPKNKPDEAAAMITEVKVADPKDASRTAVKAKDAPMVTASDVAASETSSLADAPPRGPRAWKSIVIKAVSAVIAVLALVVIIFGILIYGYKSESPVVYAVAKVIPYPVASVNGHFVSYADYLFQLNANKRGYQQNAKLNNQPAVDYKTAEGKKILAQFHSSSIDKVKSDAVVAQLAASKKVAVTDKDVNNLVDQLYKNYGGKDTLLKTLKDIYGWDLTDLKGVVRKQLLEQKLSEKVSSDPVVDTQAKAKATDVAGKVKAGGDFAALAKQYSQASDAASGGDLGSFTKGQVSDEIQKTVDALPVGGVSDPVKDQYGYEIIKVTDKSGDAAKASHILIKTVDFTDYVNQQIKQAKYKQYITS